MDSQRLSIWIQLVTGISVLFGLGLVVWELQQNREATTSQLTSDGMALVSALNTAVMGEQTADVLAKACEYPNELTTADYYVLDNYYGEILNRYRRIALLAERGTFYDSVSFDDNMGLGNLFDSAPGRAYLKSVGLKDPKISKPLQSKIAAWDGTTCAEYFGKWKVAVQDELDRDEI